MNILYEYAKNESGNFINIQDAIKTEFYYLESESKGKVQMIPVQGDVKQWHFRSKVQGEAIRMTAAHINLQAKLCNDLRFYCKELEIEITAHYAIPEYRLNNNRIVDVAYFDTNNDFLCGIEVVHTNYISPEKLKDLYNSDYLIFKVYTYAKERFRFVNNFKIDKEKNRILEQIRIIESKHKNSYGTYFNRFETIKSKLREAEGEKGKLIRDIEEITKQINNLL